MKCSLLMLSTVVLLAGCSSSPTKVSPETLAKNELNAEAAKVAVESEKNRNPYYLICKAKRSRFQFDWSAASPNRNLDLIDQNSVRYEFKAADHPAGDRGQLLKVGECSWEGHPLGAGKKDKSQFVFRSLTEEQTQAFYKMRTGKVFKLPVRHSKNGMEVLPGAEITVIR